jgi:hypothetical protein
MKKRHILHHFLIAGLFILVMVVYFLSIPDREEMPKRTLEAGVARLFDQEGSLTTVSLVVTIGPGEHTYYAIEETVPPGYTIIDTGKGTAAGNTIRWLYVNDTTQAPSARYTYTVRGGSQEAFDGIYWIEGMSGPAKITGQSRVG